jgi:hypothetical protein
MVDPALTPAHAEMLRPLFSLLNRCLSRRADQRPSTRHVLAQLLDLRSSLVAEARVEEAKQTKASLPGMTA